MSEKKYFVHTGYVRLIQILGLLFIGFLTAIHIALWDVGLFLLIVDGIFLLVLTIAGLPYIRQGYFDRLEVNEHGMILYHPGSEPQSYAWDQVMKIVKANPRMYYGSSSDCFRIYVRQADGQQPVEIDFFRHPGLNAAIRANYYDHKDQPSSEIAG